MRETLIADIAEIVLILGSGAGIIVGMVAMISAWLTVYGQSIGSL